MKKYFYTDGVNKFGPFTLDELKGKNISRNTKVWFEGLDNWQPAGAFSELNDLFPQTPPPVTESSYIHQKPPKTWLVESILVTLFCCLPFGIAGIVNAARVESRFYGGDKEGAVRSSKEAGRWTTVGFWVGIAGSLLYIFLMGVGIISGI